MSVSENNQAVQPAETSLPSDSVAADVRARLNGRRRRRGRPPGWTLWMAKAAGSAPAVRAWLYGRRDQLLTIGATVLGHVLVLWLFSLWALPGYSLSINDTLTSEFADAELVNSDLEFETQVVEEQADSLIDLDVNSNMRQILADSEEGIDSAELGLADFEDVGKNLTPTDREMDQVLKAGEFGGRSAGGRNLSVKKFGGTVESEKAVNHGLDWLKSIQQPDGSWNFSRTGPGTKPGTWQRTQVGATSLALLCYLGAGHTHKAEGKYRETVHNGLAYLGSQADVSQGIADMRGQSEGNSGMYVQALATICLSEAHAMEHSDRDLTRLTGMAVKFIERAQAPFDGGWRYKPQDDKSDTSVVGWQIMALQSARAGRISTSNKVLLLSRDYLREAQTDKEGAFYSYMPGQGQKKSMIAVALLCRMYLGWQKDRPGLQKGVAYLAREGPDRNDIYYNYYASQVMYHWGGDEWKEWNAKMRSLLVSTQVAEGPARGTWRFTAPHGGTAGTLYQTALSIMTLEVYYRHLPMYRRLTRSDSEE